MMDRAAGTVPPSNADSRSTPPSNTSGPREIHNYAPWINVLCGLAVFTLRYAAPRETFDVHWNLFVTGIVMIFAGLATTIAHGQAPRNYWSAINIVAGAWLLISAQTIPSIPTVSTAQEALGAATILLALVSLGTEIECERQRVREAKPARDIVAVDEKGTRSAT
jgi:hypothetical protein